MDKARAFYQAYDAAVDKVESIVRQEHIACDFARVGKLKLAASIRSEVGSASFHGGLLQKTSAQMHVGKFGVGLAQAAVRAGAQVYENAAVTGLDRRPDGSFRVTSARGSIDARQVLPATGSPAAPSPQLRHVQEYRQ